MARILQVMFSNCTDPEREVEFNRWYTHTHLPDLAAAPGFVSARRFRNALPAPGAATYMAVYEIEADSAATVLAELTRLALEAFDAGRHIDCIEGVRAGNTPLGAQWVEIDPASLEPLADLRYPPAPAFIRKQMVGLIDSLGDASGARFRARLSTPVMRLAFAAAQARSRIGAARRARRTRQS